MHSAAPQATTTCAFQQRPSRNKRSGAPFRRSRRCTVAMTVAAGAATATAKNHSQQPLFRFGLISDVQHADKEDGFSFHGTPRYYRYALEQLDRAVEGMAAAGVACCLHLGDIVDFHNTQLGVCPETQLHHSEKALREVLGRFERLGRPTLHLLGNHCLYNHPRPELNRRLGISRYQPGPDAAPHSYYTFRPAPGWCFIMLDGYDVSILGWPPGHPLHEQAQQLLAERNPNEEKNSGAGLVGVERRFVKFGGGVSAQQLAWLEEELRGCAAAGERVLVACHLAFHPNTCPPACLLWNYTEVLQVLRRHAGTVVGTLSGHAHSDGSWRDSAGLHHRVCNAVLETPPGRECYGIVDVFPDALHIRGVDTFASEVWPLRPLPPQPQPGAPSGEAAPERAPVAAQ